MGVTILLTLVLILCVGLLIVGWVWYPERMARLGGSRSLEPAPEPSSWPPVSVVLATRESLESITTRLENLRCLDYDADLIEFVVALDASVAHRHNTLVGENGSRVVVTAGAAPGKSSALNAGVAVASHDLLLFVDTAQTFAPDVLRLLVQRTAVPGWGAATATLQPTSGDALMDSYWRRELAVRLGQTLKHSVICVTGCAYLMHRRYWTPMPTGLICDDLWSTYSVVTNGGRVAIVPDAKVVDPRKFTREQEYSRRLRTMTGLLQFIKWFPAVLSPSKNPIWSDFLFHKMARPATPVLLIVMMVSTFVLSWRWSPGATISLILGALIGTAGMVGIAKRTNRAIAERARTIVFSFRLLFMPLRAISLALRDDWNVWQPH